MILADTSIWIDHFRRSEPRLARFLDRGEVVMHPFVIGELVLGYVPRIAEMIVDLRTLPKATMADTDEVLKFIAHRKLSGSGIGYVDAHLLAVHSQRLHTNPMVRVVKIALGNIPPLHRARPTSPSTASLRRCKGDQTGCGGSIVSGASGVFINGKPMARVDDSAW